MARGDYVEVVTTDGRTTVIEARSIGSRVEVREPKTNDLTYDVSELNKAGNAVRVGRFAKNLVVSIVDGHKEPVKRKAKT